MNRNTCLQRIRQQAVQTLREASTGHAQGMALAAVADLGPDVRRRLEAQYPVRSPFPPTLPATIRVGKDGDL